MDFSHIVGMGGRADIGFGVVLDWLSRDPGTGAILLDIRQLRNRRAFLSAARAASRLRAVVAIQAGSSIEDPGGGTERAFEAALRRAGVLCVTTLEDLLAAAEILARAKPVRSEALSIMTNAITAGRMAADAVLRNGLQLASDIVHVEPGDSERLATLATAASTPGVGGVLVVHAPSGDADEPAIAALAECRDRMKVPLLVCAMGETGGAASRRRLAEAGMAVFATPEHAVRGFLHLVQDRRNRAAARELPHSTVLTVAPDRDAVGDILASIRRAGRLASDAGRGAGGTVRLRHSGRAEPCRRVAGRCGRGGIAAGLSCRRKAPSERASRRARIRWPGARSAWCDARSWPPPERIAARDIGDAPSLLVERQAVRWRQLRIRVEDDATFGPVISFGQGGTTADIAGDASADLPPLNLALAHGLIGRTRAASTLARFRDNPPANEAAVAEALVRVSQLIVDFPEIAELDLNPLIVDTDGVLAADAWLRLREAGDDGGGLAITPYPVELVEHWIMPDGERLIVRPIRPEDADGHGAFFSRLSPQDIRYRFFSAMRELSPEQMARLTQIDYDREMAFIALRETSGETVGVARLVCEDDRQGEFAVIVQARHEGQGGGPPPHAAPDRLGTQARVYPRSSVRCWRTMRRCWPSCGISDSA